MKTRFFHKLFNPIVWLLLGLVFVVGCDQQPEPTATVVVEEPTAEPVETAEPETRALPTLYPTPSPFPTPEPTEPLPTGTPQPTATPIDFSELVIEINFSIPGLGLERRLVGNVSSQLELTDETTGETVQVTDVPGVLFELQQSLPETALSDLPAGCDLCVQLSYELFLTGESGEGWLEDPVLLASFENFFGAHLGPHFPPDTVVGLRRSATPYNVAHTVAVTAGGNLWRWTATEAEVAEPETGGETLTGLLNEFDLDSFEDGYFGPCPEGSGVERLYLSQGETERSLEIVCPELSLPLSLLPLYLQLDELADEKTEDVALPAPEPTVPLESVLYYEREDGGTLILFADGRAQAVNEAGETATGDLAENQAVDTAVSLAESGNLSLGVPDLLSISDDNILIVRGLDGVYEVGWNGAVPENLTQVVEELDSLLDELLENAEAPEDGTPEGGTPEGGTPQGTAEPDETPGEASPTPTPAEEETPEATPSE